jgi:NAD+ synthetase
MRIGIVQTRFAERRWDERLERLVGWIDAARRECCETVLFPEDALGLPTAVTVADPPSGETIEFALDRIAGESQAISVVFGANTDQGLGDRLDIEAPSTGRNVVITTLDRGRRRTLALGRSEPPGILALASFAAAIERGCADHPPVSNPNATWRLGFESVPFRYPTGVGDAEPPPAPVPGTGLICVRGVGLTAAGVLRGGSYVIDPHGRLLLHAPWFEDGLFVADTDAAEAVPGRSLREGALREALVRGLRDFVGDTGLSRTLVGLSGGIDSSVVACVAVDALGAGAVTGVSLPSAYTSEESREGAAELSRRLGIELLELPIRELHDAARRALPQPPSGVTDENLQARLRGFLLMALANQRDALVLCPGNRSEIAVGYNTLYGDTVGAVAPIGELYKSEVYRLAAEYAGTIPASVRERPPSAELRPGQRDDEDLPPYSALDPILMRLLDEGAGREELIALGSDPKLVDRILARQRGNAHKWQQLPPVIRIRERGLPRIPIA